MNTSQNTPILAVLVRTRSEWAYYNRVHLRADGVHYVDKEGVEESVVYHKTVDALNENARINGVGEFAVVPSPSRAFVYPPAFYVWYEIGGSRYYISTTHTNGRTCKMTFLEQNARDLVTILLRNNSVAGYYVVI